MSSETISRWHLSQAELAVCVVLCGGLGTALLLGQCSRPALSVVQVERDGRAVAAAQPGLRLDLNTATCGELELLPGIGRRRAEAIVAERNRRGAFETVWQLSEVPGLTPALVRRLEPLLRIGPPGP